MAISQMVTLKTPYTIYVNACLPRVSLVFNLFMEVTFQCFQRLSKITGDTEIKEEPFSRKSVASNPRLLHGRATSPGFPKPLSVEGLPSGSEASA